MIRNKIIYVMFILNIPFLQHHLLFGQRLENKLETFKDSAFATKPDAAKWNQLTSNIALSEASLNDRIVYNQYPVLSTQRNINAAGWVGETVNIQLVLSTKKYIPLLQVNAGNFISLNGLKTINKQNVSVGYVYYVIADNTAGVCHKTNDNYKNLIVPDIIDFNSQSTYAQAFTNRPIWISIKIPADAKPGTYKGKITAFINQFTKEIPVILTVNKKAMPVGSQKSFFLNLWQYPLTEADYYNVKPWSDEHLNIIKPAMIRLKEAGQQVITTSFFWDIFNSKIRSPDDMMIKVIKSKNGTWNYDFSNFDKWVNFMMNLGINKEIECFGIAPLNYRYYYLDETDNTVKFFSEGVTGKNYAEFWNSYLKAFEQHLKQKNWFSITTLGIDEKEQNILSPLINFIKSNDKNWKISFTGKYFPDLQNDIYDYSVMSNQTIPPEVLAQRNQKNYITTFYTSCWETSPNTFTMSSPADATWLGWNAANRNLNGYLRYAYDYFGKNVLRDVRGKIASGDTFIIYPEGYSSVRFEMLKDGIEDYEKIHVMQEQNNLSVKFKSVLSQFDFKKLSATNDRSVQINNARQILNN